MNFVQTTHIYGQSKLPLKYTDEALNKVIGDYLANVNEFSYCQLCNHVLSTANQEDMLEKRPNTSYSQILLTQNDTVRICKNLWERIWAKEIMILFNDPQDVYHHDNETYFIVNK